jgi:hypothetical protein
MDARSLHADPQGWGDGIDGATAKEYEANLEANLRDLLERIKSGYRSRARLASGWLAGLYREGVEPSGSLRKVSDHMIILLSCPPDAKYIDSLTLILCPRCARILFFAMACKLTIDSTAWIKSHGGMAATD